VGLWSLALGAGCGGASGTQPGFPVTGKVLVGGEPLDGGVVLFISDAAKGNSSRLRPAGQITETGIYALYAEGRPEIPPGWYKVAVESYDQAGRGRNGRSLTVRGRLLVNPVYCRAETSGLRVKVVANPAEGAYDFHLKRLEP
jgi:hypothetical protein